MLQEEEEEAATSHAETDPKALDQMIPTQFAN